MAGDDFALTFNHVGLCVRDLEAAQHFYTDALGFTLVRSLTVPDSPTAQLLRLSGAVGLTAVYLQRDGFVLELLSYADRPVARPVRERTMDEVGLTHLSLSVPPSTSLSDVLRRVAEYDGEVLDDTLIDGVAVFVRDPDGQLIELLAR